MRLILALTLSCVSSVALAAGQPVYVTNAITLDGSTVYTPSPSGQAQNGIQPTAPVAASSCSQLKGANGNTFTISAYTQTGGYWMVLDTSAAPANNTAIPQAGPSPVAAAFLTAPHKSAADSTWDSPPYTYPLTSINGGVYVCLSSSPTSFIAVSGTITVVAQTL